MIKLKSLFRRGQGPSNSKATSTVGNPPLGTADNQRFKGSSASLDGGSGGGQIIYPKSRKSHGHKEKVTKHSSRDNLDREIDVKLVSRESNHHQLEDQLTGNQKRQQKQMSLIQQQHVTGNNNLLNQRDAAAASYEQSAKREIADIGVDVTKEVKLYQLTK